MQLNDSLHIYISGIDLLWLLELLLDDGSRRGVTTVDKQMISWRGLFVFGFVCCSIVREAPGGEGLQQYVHGFPLYLMRAPIH